MDFYPSSYLPSPPNHRKINHQIAHDHSMASLDVEQAFSSLLNGFSTDPQKLPDVEQAFSPLLNGFSTDPPDVEQAFSSLLNGFSTDPQKLPACNDTGDGELQSVGKMKCSHFTSNLLMNPDIILPPCNLAFVYGTLKQGFGNHWLMQELMANGHAQYVGLARTHHRFPLVCGPFAVPFLLHIPSAGHRVHGEVYGVDEVALARLDELEGVNKGHYVRRPLFISDFKIDILADGGALKSAIVLAEAYFAAADYTPGMSRVAHPVASYSAEEASSYVRRKDRPQHLSFLEHIQAWIKDRQSLAGKTN